MTEGLEAVTVAGLSRALDLAALRHQMIATNLANANVPGYRRVQVSFGEQIDDVRQSIADRGTTDLTSLQSLSLRVVTPSNEDGEVKTDREMADMAGNAVQYQTLLKVLAKEYALLSLAANDGKR